MRLSLSSYDNRIYFTVHTNLADGPMSHDQPAYARVPGIRVYGMMCNSGNATNNRNGSNRSKRSIGKLRLILPTS